MVQAGDSGRYRFFGLASFTPTALPLRQTTSASPIAFFMSTCSWNEFGQFGPVQRRHAGALLGDVDDQAIDDGSESSRIGPGALTRGAAALHASIAILEKRVVVEMVHLRLRARRLGNKAEIFNPEPFTTRQDIASQMLNPVEAGAARGTDQATKRRASRSADLGRRTISIVKCEKRPAPVAASR